MSRKNKMSANRAAKRGNVKKVSKEVQLKILMRMNRSYEIFKKFDLKRLTDILKLGFCEKMLGDEDFETFKLSNTDKMALHKALREKVQQEQKKQESDGKEEID